MKILILEDRTDRIDTFKKELAGHTLFVTSTVEDAIKAYDTVEFDLVFIDHDLDQKVYTPITTPNSGYQFAKQRKQQLLLNTVIVHSHNEEVGPQIATMLDCPHIPFSEIAWQTIRSFEPSI